MGIKDSVARVALLIGPVVVSYVVVTIYFWRGVCKLLSVSLASSDFLSEQGRAVVKSEATRVALFSLSSLCVVMASLYFQFRLMNANPVWEKSLREYIL